MEYIKDISNPVRPKNNLFIISVDNLVSTEKPCPEAFEAYIENLDIQLERYMTDKSKKAWHKKGKNHRKQGDWLIREIVPEKAWLVELNSLAELTSFINKYGTCILSKRFMGFYEIEIYTNWMDR